MAGVNMAGDEGREIAKQSVPAIGGSQFRSSIGLPADTPVVASAHLTDGPRAEGFAYNENPGVDLDTGAYPAGTVTTGGHN